MVGSRNASLWTVVGPSAWPPAPPWMSFSTLLGLEACPRRWALGAADYPSVWNKRGYPHPLQPASLEGTIVHLCLQEVTAALVERGCPSLFHESAVAALRELGGLTAIVLRSLERVLRSYEGNPRAAAVLDGTRHRLAARAPGLRSSVQKRLLRIQLERRTGESVKAIAHPGGPFRRRLPHGSYSEVELRADGIGWHGIADLLTISGTRCEIRDFKTGASKPEHEFQLQVYALLWARDRQLNPDGRLAENLVLSYDTGDVDVPALDSENLHHLEDELRRRTAQALADLSVDPPRARPSSEDCVPCPVRQLCEEYWPWLARHGLGGESGSTSFGDLQIRLGAQHGPRSWDGVVESGPGLEGGGSVLLRTADLWVDLHPDQRLRVLNVHINVPDEKPGEGHWGDPAVVATMGTRSEVFLVTT